ncbi:hypothetical protein [Paenibacillus thiaminolyticus]|nr:hypothetical protein [Paenibacillus thiaminolyticus]
MTLLPGLLRRPFALWYGLMTDWPLAASKGDNVAGCVRASLGFAATA